MGLNVLDWGIWRNWEGRWGQYEDGRLWRIDPVEFLTLLMNTRILQTGENGHSSNWHAVMLCQWVFYIIIIYFDLTIHASGRDDEVESKLDGGEHWTVSTEQLSDVSFVPPSTLSENRMSVATFRKPDWSGFLFYSESRTKINKTALMK